MQALEMSNALGALSEYSKAENQSLIEMEYKHDPDGTTSVEDYMTALCWVILEAYTPEKDESQSFVQLHLISSISFYRFLCIDSVELSQCKAFVDLIVAIKYLQRLKLTMALEREEQLLLDVSSAKLKLSEPWTSELINSPKPASRLSSLSNESQLTNILHQPLTEIHSLNSVAVNVSSPIQPAIKPVAQKAAPVAEPLHIANK